MGLRGFVKCPAYWPPLVIAGVMHSVRQRVGHKRKRVPSPACVLAGGIVHNERGLVSVLAIYELDLKNSI